MDIIRWGIMGTGRIARTFAEAINGTDGCEIYAVASRSAAKAEDFATKYGASKSYSCYEELVSDKDVDVVYIATPTSCHYENSMMCLKHEKAVLCEKPVSENKELSEKLNKISKYSKQ